MARPLALPVASSTSGGVVRAVAAGATVLLLAAFVAWPVATVLLRGLLAGSATWPVRLAVDTAAVGVTSTLATIALGALVAVTLTRVDVRGRALLWRAFRWWMVIPPFIGPLALLALAGPHGLLPLQGLRPGLGAIVAGQVIAFLPFAVARLVRTLAGVPVDLEHAAEVLGAPRVTVLRRITLGLAAPGLIRVGLAVFGLCVADVATPVLLGGSDRVLTTAILAAAAGDGDGAARSALTLAMLAALVALAGASRDATVVGWPSMPRLDRPASRGARRMLGVASWAIAIGLAMTGLLVVVNALAHLSVLVDRPTAVALGHSVLLGFGAAVAGTALALTTTWIVERRRDAASRAIAGLARVPLAVPGVAVGVGYLLAFPPTSRLEGLGLLILVVAAWQLPVTTRAARVVLAHTERSVEQAAVSLGATGVTTFWRIIAPMLRPAAGWIFADLFAAGVLAVGTVIILTGAGPAVGAITMLTLAAAGAPGAACAVATALLAIAGGALVLGRAIAGRRHGPTLLA
jgi:iron(III) transport system permease protein